MSIQSLISILNKINKSRMFDVWENQFKQENGVGYLIAVFNLYDFDFEFVEENIRRGERLLRTSESGRDWNHMMQILSICEGNISVYNVEPKEFKVVIDERDTSGGKVKGKGTRYVLLVTLIDERADTSINAIMLKEYGFGKVMGH
ncbi:nuclease [Artemisia annua]|uniref:Nuclease n=1 Tax=Artemisia annua TaxID=35608 RepID=A0A2U1P0K9_ARTAN|nr:nuclease [Artemisia annua]